jgi:saccharopine dehydrogenase-like NADP-dependent oxidoreductase
MRQGSFSVGFPVAVVAKMLASGQVKAKGAMGSEIAIHPETFFNGLAKRRIELTATLKRTVC